MLSLLHHRPLDPSKIKTTVHVTHAKAGSTWVDALLRELFPACVAARGRTVAADNGGDLDKHYFASGRIYPAMFITRDQFLAHTELKESNCFVVIRDLRDTFASLYFSLKYSHPPMEYGRNAEAREVLNDLSEEDGLLWLVEQRGQRIAAIQTSWINSGQPVLRYEDLLHSAQDIFEELFIRKFQLPLTPSGLSRALERNGFEKVFGRKLGVEDVSSHGRRGLAGDWKNRFTPLVRKRFAERYGDVLLKTGYESDGRWVTA